MGPFVEESERETYNDKQAEATLMAKVVIKTTKKYAKYLKPHLEKEHPKTKGKIRVVK